MCTENNLFSISVFKILKMIPSLESHLFFFTAFNGER